MNNGTRMIRQNASVSLEYLAAGAESMGSTPRPPKPQTETKDKVSIVARALRQEAARFRETPPPCPGSVSFGVELEFLASRAPGLVKHYRPDDQEEQTWSELLVRDKVAHMMDWRDAAIKSRRRVAARLFRNVSQGTRGTEDLPSEMTLEPNGVFEMRKHPFTSLAQLALFLADSLETIGVPQAQVHLVFPFANVKGLSDFPNISSAQSDRAQFAKLWIDRIQGATPAASFASGFLPPLDSASRLRLARQVQWLGAGEELEDALKFLCAPVMRPGSLYGLRGSVGIEVRQWDVPTGPECPQPEFLTALLDDVLELSEWLSTGVVPAPLSSWAATPTTNEIDAWHRARRLQPSLSISCWNQMLDTIEHVLLRRNALSQKANPRCAFLFPLRSFEDSFPHLGTRIRDAQQAYLAELLDWERESRALQAAQFDNRSSLEGIVCRLREAVTTFAGDSGLAMEAYQDVFESQCRGSSR